MTLEQSGLHKDEAGEYMDWKAGVGDRPDWVTTL